MRLIYPADTFNPKCVDEVYADEFAPAQALGISTSIFSFEDFLAGQFRPRPVIEAGEQVLFRCWMMTAADYERLHSSVTACGGIPITEPSAYQLCHYLPKWYPYLCDETAETKFFSEFDDLASDLTAAGWNGCFLKDYVKSLSTDGGSVIRDFSEIPNAIAKMRKYRGCIEGGLCARKLEDYDASTERRYFVWRGNAFSDEAETPSAVQLAASLISSPFFTVDVARRSDGRLRIIELGDGQVSDRKHWDSHTFLSLLR